jgi:hypothetical protein
MKKMKLINFQRIMPKREEERRKESKREREGEG